MRSSNSVNDAMKRATDVVFGAIALLVLAPVIGATALVVRVALGRPALFRHVRPGLHGRPFTMYKFRTMREVRDAEGHQLPDDLRLTRVGRFLRSTSLDEIPELWNVVRGDMSLVGPRPLLMEYLPLYTAEQARRHSIRPGITGWAQVHGRNELTWDQKFERDLWYVENRTALLDLRILLLTFAHVIARDGINQPGRATTEPFRGVIS